MDPGVEEQLIERVLAHLAAGTSEAAEHEARLSIDEYLDAERLVRERRALFERLPIAIAPASQLAAPGAFVTFDELGVPLVATRDDDGRPHVLVNACLHRGTRLVAAGAGACKTFVCPYHAWSYGCDGHLLGVNQARSFPDTARERPGLVELPSAERAGMVWTSLDRSAGDLGALLDGSLGALAPELDALARAYPVAWRPDARTWRGNWKIFVDGGLETYHFRIAHSDTISPMFHDDFLVRDAFGAHQRMILPRRTFGSLAGVARAPGALRAHANLVYLLFPNVLLLAQADHLVSIAAFPRGVGESRIVVTMHLAAEPEGERALAYWEKNRRITLTVLDEDFQIGERVHEGLAARAFPEVRLGRNEIGLVEYHRQIDTLLRAS